MLHNIQKGKIPSPNEWTIEFFLALYETIGEDILRLVEESRTRGFMHPPLSTTFFSLIPKSNHSEPLRNSDQSLCAILLIRWSPKALLGDLKGSFEILSQKNSLVFFREDKYMRQLV